MRRLLVAGLAVLAVAGAGCRSARHERHPDVVLVTIDRLRWEELSPWGGDAHAPALGEWRPGATEFAGAVSHSPGGAPAALSVLTGLPPSGHGIRLAEETPVDSRAQSLADRLGASGWATGGFQQTDQVTLFTHADRGFVVWDGPPLAFPVGIPSAVHRRDLEDTTASALTWLLRLPEADPGFAWIHLAEPAPPDLPAKERMVRLSELDRMLGAVFDAAHRRGEARGLRPIVVVCNLSSHGPDPRAAAREAFLLDAGALRVRALVSAPGLRAGVVEGLAGLDEIAALVELLATAQGDSRLARLAAGTAEPRDVVVAETALPMTCGAEPLQAAVREMGPSRGDDDPAVAASLASDAGWPGGRGGPRAADVVEAYLALDAAWSLARREGVVAALGAFEAAAAAGALPGARVGRGIALAAAGRAREAQGEFRALQASARAGTLAWSQARLGLAVASRAAGDAASARAALDEMLVANPRDPRALTRLVEVAESTGSRADAVEAARRLLDFDPDNPFALAELGRLLASGGRPQEAARAYDLALTRQPTQARLLLGAAEAHAAARDWWRALELVNDLIASHGESPEADLLLARCWQETGRHEAAAERYLRVLSVRPADARAEAGLAAARRAIELQAATDMAPSLPVLRLGPVADDERIDARTRSELLPHVRSEARVRIVVDLAEQPDLVALGRMAAEKRLPRAERRRFVAGALRAGTPGVRALVAELRDRPEISDVVASSCIARVAITAPSRVVEELAAREDVVRCWARPLDVDPPPMPATPPSRPAGSPWAVAATGAPAAWEAGLTGSGVHVSVLDSMPHEVPSALAGRQVATGAPAPGAHDVDEGDGHGLSVLGAAVASGGIGVAPQGSWSFANPLGGGVLDPEAFASAVDWLLLEAQPDVVIVPWDVPAGEVPDFQLAIPFGALRTAGMAVAFSAGNEGPRPGANRPPSNLANLAPDGAPAFSVGGVSRRLEAYPASSRGPRAGTDAQFPLICAPGEDVAVLGPRGDQRQGHGTSLAVGYAAGVLALALEADPMRTGPEAEALILRTARDLGPPGADMTYGHGLVNASVLAPVDERPPSSGTR